MSAYLIRSRPSGRKINSLACCYCRAGGRVVTRAQHNIYTIGLTHARALTSTYTCTHSGANKRGDAYTYTKHPDQNQVSMLGKGTVVAQSAEIALLLFFSSLASADVHKTHLFNPSAITFTLLDHVIS